MRKARLTLETEALGTARANESIDVTAKVSNQVTAVRFRKASRSPRAGAGRTGRAQARADLAVAEAALNESRSQFKRSRELYTTQVLSEAQIEQIEATLKANEARVASARARLNDTFVRAPFAGRVGLRRVSVGSLGQPGRRDHDARRHQHDQARFHGAGDAAVDVQPGLAIEARSVAYPGEDFAGRVASVDSRVDPSTRSVTVRALLPNDEGAAQARACS